MAAPHQAPHQTIWTIPARLPFVDTLAAGLLRETEGAPDRLARLSILLPTRRARRTLREAFLRRSHGRALLLPRLLTVSDLDDEAGLGGLGGSAGVEIPPEIPALRRQILLTRLILAAPGAGKAQTADQAALLAAELGRLLDQVQTEGLGFDRLADLVPDSYAEHWQITLDFLKILTSVWPQVLASEGCLDPADRRNRLLRAQADLWKTHSPGPVLAAGLTGSVPAAADLLAVVAALPEGRVVLPGLDRFLDDDSWATLGETHPQYTLKRLLDRLGLPRDAVADWPVVEDSLLQAAAPASREQLISETLRPAETTHHWRDLAETPLPADAISGVERLDCPAPREEALAIALRMRAVLETPDHTCALVTPDRDLGRRVAAELGRWGLTVDDSAGQPLTVSPPGAFLRLTATLVERNFAPVSLLSVLKHPLCSAGLEPAVFRDAVRRLELLALRGVRPAPGLAGLRQALAERETPVGDLDPLLTALDTCCAPFAALMAEESVPFATLLEAHMVMAEALAGTPDRPGPLWLWAERAGEEAAAFVRELADSAATLGDIAPTAYPGLLQTLMLGRGVRSEFGSHPRLSILGPMESRLYQADVMILGGLNDTIWPPAPTAAPWMSRPMRGDFGLPQPEQKVGHAAHDFAMAFCAPQVLLTRSAKVDGTPTVPSRWLLRLDTVLAASRHSLAPPQVPWLGVAMALDTPDRVLPPQRPSPRPPVAARPRKLSVTRVETWMRDPYAIYAQYILGLQALDPLEAEPGPADYGTLVHKAMELFLTAHPRALPADPLASLLSCGRQAFAEHLDRPAVWAFWWPRFERLAEWVIRVEEARRPAVVDCLPEQRGELAIGSFTVTATADRIDRCRDGTLAIIDYKTGILPKTKEIAAGFSPQLPLEALIARSGGFGGLAATPVSELLFWHVTGSGEGGKEVSACGKDKTIDQLADEALEGLQGLIAAFDNPETPYEPRPHPDHAPRYSDYQHLARVKEWASGEEDDSE